MKKIVESKNIPKFDVGRKEDIEMLLIRKRGK